MKRMLVVLLIAGLSLWSAGAGADSWECLEPVAGGEINWTQGIILAKGSGAPPKEAKNIAQARLMTERAALADARRNLLEVLKGVRVDSTTLVENYVVKSDEIRLKAEGFIQGSAELKDRRKYLSDGAVEVTVALSLAGDFLALLLSPPKEAPRPDTPATPPPPPQVAAPPSLVALPPAGAEQAKTLPAPAEGGEKPPAASPLPSPADLPKFTGLVIDARGLNLRAALIPRLLDENGQEIYRGAYVGAEKAAQNGLALYSRDLTAAQTNPRVGKNPLTVKGARVDTASPATVFLKGDDARRVLPFAQKGTFLEECRVMIVLD